LPPVMRMILISQVVESSALRVHGFDAILSVES
jgi:hypothetical protein